MTEPMPVADVLDAWDKLHDAIQRTLTAQPFQMTAAVTSLEAERQRFHQMLQAFAFKAMQKPT